MHIVTNLQLMISAAAFTLAAMHLRVALGTGGRRMHLLFAVGSAGLGVYALFERPLMIAETPAEYGWLLRYAQIPVNLTIVIMALFVREYMGTGRDRLLAIVIASRVISLVFNFTTGENINFVEITSIKKLPFFGQMASVPIGVPNKAMILGQIGLLISIIYFVDAAVSAWRRGDKWRGGVVGGSVAVISVVTLGVSIAVPWGLLEVPLFASPYFLLVIGAMGFELSYELKRAAETSEELSKARDENAKINGELALSASAASVGVWSRDLDGGPIMASDKWREMFGFEPGQTISFQDYISKVHPDDREKTVRTKEDAEKYSGQYEIEFRIVLPSGEIKWIGSTGSVAPENGSPRRVRGASVDITARKLAEETAHELSRSVMQAQEKERARIARELHDGLSQSMALLSINLQGVSLDGVDEAAAKNKVAGLTLQLAEMSSEMHRISHELHPAKLGQLGLEAALKGFCRESGSSYGLNVDFVAANIPRVLPDDISLCLFRIAQESLRNIAKHSGAEHVTVELATDGPDICLSITDDGRGFDPAVRPSNGSLGLISMIERIRAVHGTVTVNSVIGSGTTVHARVPDVV